MLLAAGGAALAGRPARATAGTLSASATASPAAVVAGERVTYRVTVRNAAQAPLGGLALAVTLPAGMDYVPGSARVRANGLAMPLPEPSLAGATLSWAGLTVPVGRTGGALGMHTFVQDRWEDTDYQLDRVVDLMGPGAYVKQLLYNIPTYTDVLLPKWQHFVNACYDRNLIPVVRLAGEHAGEYWHKPAAVAPGDYSGVASEYARVVAALPLREGRPLYVEVGNEPNLDIEWGGRVNATEYAHFLVDVAAALRALGDGRIRILNGGLSPTGDVAPLAFIDDFAAVPGALEAFDVWAAHPYPGNRPPEMNLHEGTAKTYRHVAIDSYLLELERLALHGRTGLQVLLTETGYALGASDFAFLGHAPIGEANRADYIVRALREYWSDWPEVLGVCPYELYDPLGKWAVWDWLGHAQYAAVDAMDPSLPPAAGLLYVEVQTVANAEPGTHTLRVEASAAGAGSVSLPATAPVQVAAAPPPPTPTPSPTLPVPPDDLLCYAAIQNGGFERDTCWELPETVRPATYTTRRVHSGRRALQVGIVDGDPVRASSSAWQQFHVPASAVSVRLRLAYLPLSGDAAGGAVAGDSAAPRQQVLLMDANKAYLETAMSVAQDTNRWMTLEYETAGHAGRTLWLYIAAQNYPETEGVTAMFVDDVEVQVCLPADAPPPPPLEPCPWVGRALRLPLVFRGAILQRPATPPAAGLDEASVPAPAEIASPEPAEGGDASTFAAALPEGLDVDLLAHDPARRRVYAAGGGQLVALDGVTGRGLYAASLPAGVGALAVEGPTGRVWVSLPEAGAVWALDTLGRPEVQVGGLGRPTGVACGEGVVYVADSAGRRALAIDAATGALRAERALDAAPYALVHDPARRVAYVGLMGEGRVAALDGETLEPLGEVALGGMGFPQGLAVDPIAGRLYVAHALAPKYGALTAVDTATMTVVATLRGDHRAPLVGARQVWARPGGERLYLATSAGLATIEGRDLSLDAVEPAVGGPAAYALDLAEGVVYAAAAGGVEARRLPPAGEGVVR